MLSNQNKIIAFILASILTIVSWVIIFTNIILRITSLMQIGLYSIEPLGFFLTTILLSIFTISILFKIRATSYTPVILILFYLMSLNGTGITYFYVIMSLLILILLNTGAVGVGDGSYQQSQYRRFYRTSNSNNSSSQQTTQANTSQHNFNNDDVFDAEYSTKE